MRNWNILIKNNSFSKLVCISKFICNSQFINPVNSHRIILSPTLISILTPLILYNNWIASLKCFIALRFCGYYYIFLSIIIVIYTCNFQSIFVNEKIYYRLTFNSVIFCASLWMLAYEIALSTYVNVILILAWILNVKEKCLFKAIIRYLIVPGELVVFEVVSNL